MKCPKCGYVSHDYLDACRKCSIDLVAFKHEISLAVLEPGRLDLSILVGGNGMSSVSSANGKGSEYDKSSSFLGASMLVETEATERDDEDEVDIRLDDDTVNAMPTPKQAPGSLTREFFVPDELLADEAKEISLGDHGAPIDTQATGASDAGRQVTQDPITEEILNLDFDEESISNETFFTESVTDDGTDVIDMNALQELRDAFSEPEDVDVEAIEPALEPNDAAAILDDSAAIDLDSASFDLDATLLEEEAAIPPLQETTTEDVASSDDTQLDDVIAEPPNASGSLELPEDFQLGDFQAAGAQPQDAMPDQPQASGGIELPEDFQLGESMPEEPAAPAQFDAASAAAVEPAPTPPQAEPERAEKITLSLPIDPNTETLFFDQLSDTAELAGAPGQEVVDHDITVPQDHTDAPVAEQDEATDTPIPLDELSSELLTEDLLGAESTLELNLELELPSSEPLVADEVDEVPGDQGKPDSDKGAAQS